MRPRYPLERDENGDTVSTEGLMLMSYPFAGAGSTALLTSALHTSTVATTFLIPFAGVPAGILSGVAMWFFAKKHTISQLSKKSYNLSLYSHRPNQPPADFQPTDLIVYPAEDTQYYGVIYKIDASYTFEWAIKKDSPEGRAIQAVSNSTDNAGEPIRSVISPGSTLMPILTSPQSHVRMHYEQKCKKRCLLGSFSGVFAALFVGFVVSLAFPPATVLVLGVGIAVGTMAGGFIGGYTTKFPENNNSRPRSNQLFSDRRPLMEDKGDHIDDTHTINSPL